MISALSGPEGLSVFAVTKDSHHLKCAPNGLSLSAVESDEDGDSKEQVHSAEDVHPTGWKVKGKRNSFGNHSPTTGSNGTIGYHVCPPLQLSYKG